MDDKRKTEPTVEEMNKKFLKLLLKSLI